MGIILVIIGAILMGCGFFFTFSGKEKVKDLTGNMNKESFADKTTAQNPDPSIQAAQTSELSKSHLNSSKNTEPSSVTDNASDADAKQKGNDFEGYVADILKANDMRLKEWNQGTSSPDGVYAENEFNPDFRVVDKDKNLEYWVECKFRSSLPPKGFSLEETQLSRYHQIQGKTKKKVLIALGVGGTATEPDRFYIIPVDTLVQYKRIGPGFLPNYSLNNPKINFKKQVRDWFYEEVFQKKQKL